MNETTPAPLDLHALSGYFVPDAVAEPRPPYQIRGQTELFLIGQMPPEIAERLLPKGLKMLPGGVFCMAVCDAPEGWGPMPYRKFFLSVEVEGYNSVDGRSADYVAAGTVSGRAGEIFARDYNANYHIGDIDFAVVDGSITASAPLEGGEGRISFSARRGSDLPGTDAGVVSFIGADGDGGLTTHSIGYSFTFTSVSDIQIKVDLPPGHRLEFLRNLRPDWGLYMWDKGISISAPQPLIEAYGDASSRMAFLDALSHIGRAVAIVEQTGRVAFLTREAEALLKDDHGLALTRLPAAVSRTALANPLDPLRQPALITLTSGRQLAARAFPIALRLGHGPLSMVLLTDPRAPGPTDPEPLLRLMGLTPAEAALASLIGQGHALARAADQRRVTPATARSMLKLIFAKLGVSRQAELAILVTRLQSA